MRALRFARRYALAWVLPCALPWICSDAAVARTPSVAVTTAMPARGSLPDLVHAYGAATPSVNGTRTLSVAQDGIVLRVLHGPGEAVARNGAVLQWQASAPARQLWEQAKTALALARQQRAHLALLLERHLATRDQLDQADKSVSDADAAVRALIAEGADQAVRDVVSPSDALVLSVPVTQGQLVPAGTVLATLTRLDALVVTVGVEPGRLARLRIGESASMRPIGAAGRSVESIDGSVLRIGAMLDPRTRLVPVDLAAPPGRLLDRVDYQADIAVGTIAGWTVPHDSLLQDEQGDYLFQAADGKAVRVPVTVRASSGATDLVSGPIDAGRPIVRDGAAQLSDGAALRQAAAR